MEATGQSKTLLYCARYLSSDRLHDTSHLRKEDFIVSVCSRDGTAEYVARNRKQGLAVTPQRPAPSGLDLPAGPHVQGFYNLPKLNISWRPSVQTRVLLGTSHIQTIIL